MEMETPARGPAVKKVFLWADGRAFCYDKRRGQIVKMNSLNLSWVPIDYFRYVLSHAEKRGKVKIASDQDILKMRTLGALTVPITVRLKARIKAGIKKILGPKRVVL